MASLAVAGFNIPPIQKPQGEKINSLALPTQSHLDGRIKFVEMMSNLAEVILIDLRVGRIERCGLDSCEDSAASVGSFEIHNKVVF